MRQIKKVNSFEDNLFSDITFLIETRQQEVLKQINHHILYVFYALGGEFSSFYDYDKLKNQLSNSSLLLSSKLIKEFGPYFNNENILMSIEFFRKCSPLLLDKISGYIGWDYVPLIFDVTSERECIFYLRLALEGNFSLSELKKMAKSKEFYNKRKANFKNSVHPFTDFAFKKNSVIPNYFKEPYIFYIQPLLEPSTVKKAKKLSLGEGEIFDRLYIRITESRNSIHSYINMRFNLMFEEIGTKIRTRFSEHQKSMGEQETIILNLGQALQNKYGHAFDKSQLLNCISFSKFKNDSYRKIDLASIVTWPHLQKILPLQNSLTQIFYAQLAAKEILSPTALEKQIQNRSFENNFPENTPEFNDFGFNKVTISVKEKKEDRGSLTINTFAVPEAGGILRNNRLVSNMFKNNFFMNFMTSFE